MRAACRRRRSEPRRATLPGKPMNLDGNAILASLLIGLVGTACFIYGRRQGRFPPMAVGAVMVVYPYFVPNLVAMVAIAVALLGVLWGVVRLGY
jgi:hypothetical protein